MSDADAAEIARRFIGVWSHDGSSGLLERLAHPDIVVSYAHFAEPIRGRDAFAEGLRQTFHHFPDLVTSPRTVVGHGGRAAVEWVYEGTHRNGEMFGVEPSGTRVRVEGATFYEIEDGLVVRERGVADVLGLMRQLGAA